ncbi:MAG: hypothetical protein ACI85E_000974, partial [Marinomonas primoryensis]
DFNFFDQLHLGKPVCDDLLKPLASAHTNYLIIYFKERANLNKPSPIKKLT